MSLCSQVLVLFVCQLMAGGLAAGVDVADCSARSSSSVLSLRSAIKEAHGWIDGEKVVVQGNVRSIAGQLRMFFLQVCFIDSCNMANILLLGRFLCIVRCFEGQSLLHSLIHISCEPPEVTRRILHLLRERAVQQQ
jgi:hypothetical protein